MIDRELEHRLTVLETGIEDLSIKYAENKIALHEVNHKLDQVLIWEAKTDATRQESKGIHAREWTAITFIIATLVGLGNFVSRLIPGHPSTP